MALIKLNGVTKRNEGNGLNYQILLTSKNKWGKIKALLKSEYNGEYVIANGYNAKTGEWGNGDYYKPDQSALAINRFSDKDYSLIDVLDVVNGK
jgi:hypothetical protein